MVKDEEKNLKRCLDSLKKLLENNFSELIIVDTGSKDRTVEIAKEYTNKIYFHEWNNNFSDMRNISISYATGDWIFIIDADEELENPEELIYVFNNDLSIVNTIALNVKNLSTLKSKKNYMLNASPRIFRNDGSFKYVGAVHNQPIFKEPILYTKASLWHYGYIIFDKALMEKKFIRTSNILKNELKKEPNNIYYIYQLGIAYSMYGRSELALEEFRKAYHLLKNKNIKDKFIYSYIYGAYSREAFINKQFREAIECCNEGIKIRRDFIDLYYILGFSYLNINDVNKAIETFNKYLNLLDKLNDLEITKDMSICLYHIDNVAKENVYYELARCYYENKQYENARNYALKLKMDNKKILLITKIALKTKNYNEFIYILNKAENEDQVNYFYLILEDAINVLDKENVRQIREFMSKTNNLYGSFSKVLYEDDKYKAVELAKTINFDFEPIFYAQLFKYIEQEPKSFIDILKKIDTNKLKNILYYLINKYNFEEFFKGILLNTDYKNVYDKKNIQFLYATYSVILSNYASNIDEIDDLYFKLFINYIDIGKQFLEIIYNEKVRINYKLIEDAEHKFIILCSTGLENIERNNYKVSLKYLKEAIKYYPEKSKYVKHILDNIENDDN